MVDRLNPVSYRHRCLVVAGIVWGSPVATVVH